MLNPTLFFRRILPVYLWAFFALLHVVLAKTHTFHYVANWTTTSLEGQINEQKVIALNGQWPMPDIHVNRGDRVQIYLTNGFNDGTVTSMHFHGVFHRGADGNQNQMDGATMITQCPIVPGQTYLYNFTVPNQVGTFWYHSHQGAQYGDGFRGAFVIHDKPNEPFDYDEEFVIPVSEIYLKPTAEIDKFFLSRYNPTGAEPIPQSMLFNNTIKEHLDFEPDKTYLIRFLNQGLFISQYLGLDSHSFTIVEVDGVYVEPYETDLLYIAAAQRISVLVKAKSKLEAQRNYGLWQIMDDTMLDDIPYDLVLNRTHDVVYDPNLPMVNENDLKFPNLKNATNEIELTPLDPSLRLYEKYDRQITLDVRMRNLGDGIKYAFFNNVTYVHPKVPTLGTALSAGDLATDPRIYGDNINVFVLDKDEVVEVVLNNYDTGRHPFHLHGHIFQIVQKSPAFHEDEDFDEDQQDDMTVPYNESKPLMPFLERPVMRDTAVLEPNGHIVLRFKADNPGVWIFHCHLDWHLEQGLAAVFVEDPKTLQEMQSMTKSFKDSCRSAGMPYKGNAAGHTHDWYDFTGLPLQPKELPSGFTTKGYFAFLVCTLAGLWGLWTIAKYGLNEVVQNDEEVKEKLKSLLDQNNITYNLDD